MGENKLSPHEPDSAETLPDLYETDFCMSHFLFDLVDSCGIARIGTTGDLGRLSSILRFAAFRLNSLDDTV